MQIYLKLTLTLFSMFIFSGCVLDDHSNQVYYESLEKAEENVPEVDESEIPSSVSLLEPTDQNNELIESTHDVTEDTIAVVNLEAVLEPVIEPAPLPESIVEPTPQPTVEETPEPIVKSTPEPITVETPLPVIEPTPEPIPVCKSGQATHQGKVKDISTGEGLADVLVTINGCTTTTDSNGFYALSNIVEKTSAVVNFEKEGYLLGSTHIQLKPLLEDSTTSNYLDQYMYKCNSHWDYNSTRAINGAHIIIGDSISYSDEHGNKYSGINTAELAYFDVTTDKKILFPGLFKGINTNGELVQFSSYSIISLLIKDDNGNKLNFANDDTITLRFDAVPSLKKPDIVPLWYYDYDQGLWFEEGYAQLQEDGTYKGEISHLGTWSLNKPLENEPGIFKGRIIDENGEPMSYVRLQAIGNNWISSDLSTDEEGIFEVEVIPDSEFKLKAYDYENKFGATSASLPALKSGEIVEDRM